MDPIPIGEDRGLKVAGMCGYLKWGTRIDTRKHFG
jgi:hypothetical protein